MSGTVLWLMGEGLQFASRRGAHRVVRAGPQRDDPLPQPPAAGGPAGRRSRRSRVERATVLVGPALILTSVVLACGLAVTVLSDLPSLRIFGWLSAFAMIAALVADLLILRPTAMFLFRLARRAKLQRRSPPRRRSNQLSLSTSGPLPPRFNVTKTSRHLQQVGLDRDGLLRPCVRTVTRAVKRSSGVSTSAWMLPWRRVR